MDKLRGGPWFATLLVGSIVLTGCGGPTPTPIYVTPEPSVEPARTLAPPPAPSIAEPSVNPARYVDPAGDWHAAGDASGPVAGPDYIDLLAITATFTADTLDLAVELAAPPPDVSFDQEALNYLVIIKTLPGEDDLGYWLTYENRADGSWSASLTDFVGDGGSATVSVEATGATLTSSLPVTMIGNPDKVRICVEAQQSTPQLEVLAEDSAPGDDCHAINGPWLVVAAST